MAVRSANLRIEKWKQKLSGEALSVITGKQMSSMTDQITAIFPELENLENGVKVILAEAGVPTILNPSYLNYGREVWRLVKKFSGGQLLNEANIKLNRWVAEGLDQDELEKIRDAVFTLAAPTP